MSKPLDTLLDYVVRTTSWAPGGADRHAALLALGELGAAVPAPYRPSQQPTEGELGWAPSSTRYCVEILNCPRAYFDDVDEALRHAHFSVYASPMTLRSARDALLAGYPAEWGYGSSGAKVWPPAGSKG